MRVRALDTNHDWLFGKGQNDYLTQNAAIIQLVNTRLNSFLGNCFFDLGAGIDWFNFLGSKDQIGLNLAVRATILNTSDENDNQVVTGLKQLVINFQPGIRKINLRYNIITVYSSAIGVFEFDLNGSS